MRWTKNELQKYAADFGLSVVPSCGSGATWYQFIKTKAGEHIFTARGMECATAFLKGYQAGSGQ